jgi:hypothetical protein
MKPTTINRDVATGLLKSVMEGTIHRDRFPEVFPPTPKHIICPDKNVIELMPLGPYAVAPDEKRELIRAILRGNIDPSKFPALFDNGITVLLPT